MKVSYASYFCLSPEILSQFTLEMCAAPKNCEKFTKTFYFGGFRSFKVIDVDKSKSLSPALVMISSMSIFYCNRFYAI